MNKKGGIWFMYALIIVGLVILILIVSMSAGYFSETKEKTEELLGIADEEEAVKETKDLLGIEDEEYELPGDEEQEDDEEEEQEDDEEEEPPTPEPEICDNTIDDDLDGLTDCADSDCVEDINCLCSGEQVEGEYPDNVYGFCHEGCDEQYYIYVDSTCFWDYYGWIGGSGIENYKCVWSHEEDCSEEDCSGASDGLIGCHSTNRYCRDYDSTLVACNAEEIAASCSASQCVDCDGDCFDSGAKIVEWEAFASKKQEWLCLNGKWMICDSWTFNREHNWEKIHCEYDTNICLKDNSGIYTKYYWGYL